MEVKFQVNGWRILSRNFLFQWRLPKCTSRNRATMGPMFDYVLCPVKLQKTFTPKQNDSIDEALLHKQFFFIISLMRPQIKNEMFLLTTSTYNLESPDKEPMHKRGDIEKLKNDLGLFQCSQTFQKYSKASKTKTILSSSRVIPT